MWCLTSRESLEVLAADCVSRQSGREEATSIQIRTKVIFSGGITKVAYLKVNFTHVGYAA